MLHNCSKSSFQTVPLSSASSTNKRVKSKALPCTELSKVTHNQRCVCVLCSKVHSRMHRRHGNTNSGGPSHIKPSFGAQGVALQKRSHEKNVCQFSPDMKISSYKLPESGKCQHLQQYLLNNLQVVTCIQYWMY